MTTLACKPYYCVNCYWDLICLPYRKGYTEADRAKFTPEQDNCFLANDEGHRRAAEMRGEDV